jgi:ribonucleotide monophosphatase NagD (HAD superfamily)
MVSANNMYKYLKRSFSKKPRVPGILSDIDGVVYRGGHEIGNSRKVIKTLLNHTVKGLNVKLPFALLTNGGGMTEGDRASLVNSIIGLEPS